MTKQDLIRCIRAAAAQGDAKTCTRLYVENRISRAVFDQAVSDGRTFGEFVRNRDQNKQAAA